MRRHWPWRLTLFCHFVLLNLVVKLCSPASLKIGNMLSFQSSAILVIIARRLEFYLPKKLVLVIANSLVWDLLSIFNWRLLSLSISRTNYGPTDFHKHFTIFTLVYWTTVDMHNEKDFLNHSNGFLHILDFEKLCYKCLCIIRIRTFK